MMCHLYGVVSTIAFLQVLVYDVSFVWCVVIANDVGFHLVSHRVGLERSFEDPSIVSDKYIEYKTRMFPFKGDVKNIG